MKEYNSLASQWQYGWTEMWPSKLSSVIAEASSVFEILREKMQFDAIAFTGSSGAAIAFVLAFKYEIPLIYVRKENEISHGFSVECNTDEIVKKYLIVDDFISSGETMRKIVHGISKFAEEKGAYPAEPVGILCFDERSFSGFLPETCQVPRSNPFNTLEIPIFAKWSDRHIKLNSTKD